jgi:hypothetical protein
MTLVDKTEQELMYPSEEEFQIRDQAVPTGTGWEQREPPLRFWTANTLGR